jgi:hypothetical protein
VTVLKKTTSVVFVMVGLMLALAIGAWVLLLQDDHVTLINTSGSENGILVDGMNGNAVLSDQSFTSTTDTLGVRHLSPAMSNEIISFTNFRPVAVRSSVPWTNSTDNVSVPFPAQITIPITIWMLKRPQDTSLCAEVVSIWNAERMGVAFSSCDTRDATSAPSSLLKFDCTMKSTVETTVTKVPNRINVYIVKTVDSDGYGDPTNGDTCTSNDFVAFGWKGNGALLAHELGHSFELTHIDGSPSPSNPTGSFPGFDDTNVMHSWSINRQYFTEGQLFRAHLTPASALNSVYNARPSPQFTRLCLPNDITAQCPALSKRIWTDGAFPPN